VAKLFSLKLNDHEYVVRPSKIICLLRNYKAHARELGNTAPERPRFFLKSPSSLIPNRGTILIPEGVKNIHHEVELAVIVGRKGRFIDEADAGEYIEAYTVMLDITARDIQAKAKSKGLPWTEAKGFDTFAPVGPRAYPADIYDWHDKRIWLSVNGDIRQDGNTNLMLFGVERIIHAISLVMSLEPGDIIMTGTPAGVGPLENGDRVEAGIEGMEKLCANVGMSER